MSYTARFNFVGTPVIPKEKKDAKRPFFKEFTKEDGKKKKKMISMTFGVKESDNNMAFVEAFDSEQEVIKTFDSDNNKMDVDWDDRFDEDNISAVANYRKYIVDLGEDFGGRQEFITAYDMIKHLKEWLPKYDGRVVVTGNFTRDWYAKKKQYYSKFRIQNVFAAPEDRKSRLMITAELFYNKKSLDDVDFDDTKKMTLDAYIEQYINKDEGRKFVPIQTVFSAAKYDLDNERHKKLLDYKLKYLKVKNKKMVHIPWEMVLLRGAEEADFDESMLTDAQKEQIELGIKTLDDFKPRGGILGDRIDEFRLFDPKLEGDYADGVLELSDEDQEDFDERIYDPPMDETLEEAKSKSKKSEEKKSAKSTKSKKEDEDADEDEPPFDEDEKNDGVDDEDLF